MLKSPATRLKLWHGICATHCWVCVIFIKVVSFLLLVDKQSQCEVGYPELVPMGSRTWWVLAERYNWVNEVRYPSSCPRLGCYLSGDTRGELLLLKPHQFFWSQPLSQKRGMPLGSVHLLATFVPLKKRVFSNFLSGPTVLPTSCQEGFKWDTITWSPSPSIFLSSSAPRISTWHGFKMKEEDSPSSLIFKYPMSGVWFRGWNEELRGWRSSVGTFLPG